MSQFLAPIHFWLYEKIENQENWIDEILNKIGEKESFRQREGGLPEGGLEKNIDTGSIHGWLQEQIQESEKRLARAVALGKEKGLSLEDLKEIYFSQGKKRRVEDPKAFYQKVNDSLLDGMPCDRVNQLVEETDTSLAWERTADLHGTFFEEEGLKGEDYYELRDAFLQGMAGNMEYERKQNQYCIRRV